MDNESDKIVSNSHPYTNMDAIYTMDGAHKRTAI